VGPQAGALRQAQRRAGPGRLRGAACAFAHAGRPRFAAWAKACETAETQWRRLRAPLSLPKSAHPARLRLHSVLVDHDSRRNAMTQAQAPTAAGSNPWHPQLCLR